ncbi:MAG: lysophospholipid acyltransferase family protein [Euzebya sp.]
MINHLFLRFIARLFRILAWPFVRWEFRGGACIGDRDGWIFSANHRSVFDFAHAVVALAHFGKDARIMIASEFWDMPVYKWGVWAINAIPVYRTTDPRGAFQAAITALEDQDSICIMPEGRLRWDPDHPLKLGRLKSGVSRMAVGANAPIMPIALVGGERVWIRGLKFPRLRLRRQVVLCRVADEPLWLSGEDHRANCDKLREVQESLLRQATADLRALDPSYLPAVTP